MATKPIILPDSFSGDSSASWESWLLHFEDCASVNGWDADNKLRFLKVRITGRAQAVFHRLGDTDKETFAHAIAALKSNFEPEGRRELYLADFSTRTRRPSESWMEFAEEPRWLAGKAYPDLDGKAHEQLALTHFLHSITDPQVVLSVKQKNPTSLAEAVTATMQVECILSSSRVVTSNDYSPIPVQAVTGHEDKLVDLITKLSDKIDKRSVSPQRHQQPRFNRSRPPQSAVSSRRPVVCYRCHQKGHFARGCALPRRQQGNDQPPAT